MKKLLSISLIIITIACIFSGCSSIIDIGIGGVTDDMYIGAAKQIMSKSLKNPSSLTVNNAYIYEKDDYGSAIVYLDITSQNSFGGAARDYVYVCVQHLDSDGNFTYNPSLNYVNAKGGSSDEISLNLLKKYNNFGEPKE